MSSDTWNNLSSAKQQRLLDAALAEFGGRGFEAGSLNVIARDAGVSKGSLFQYFDDKLDLWRTVVNETAERVRRAVTIDEPGDDSGRVDEVADGLGLWPELHVLVDRWLDFYDRHPAEAVPTPSR
jgi:AcrR family transcriptional regulator